MSSHSDAPTNPPDATHTVIALDHQVVWVRPIHGGLVAFINRSAIPFAYLNAPLIKTSAGFSLVGNPPPVTPEFVQHIVAAALSAIESAGVPRDAARAMAYAALTSEVCH